MTKNIDQRLLHGKHLGISQNIADFDSDNAIVITDNFRTHKHIPCYLVAAF
jgi:hypothetical protein